MFGENFYKQVRQNKTGFLIVSLLAIIFSTGISFTFIVPTLKGSDWMFVAIALLFFFVVANIFVGLFKERLPLIFTVSLLFSALGMGSRLWLEWGEFSLIEHMSPVVLIGYPIVVAVIISLIYYFASRKYLSLNNI